MLSKIKIILFSIVLLSANVISAQELIASVGVNSSKIQGSNKQMFETLQKTLTEFINETKWTNLKVKPQERIRCNFTITINELSGNNYKGTIQVQSSRPIYDTSYSSPILNINDQSFDFRYNEFDQFLFNPESYDSNLISTIAFYVYVILGVDADTFALNGGDKYLRIAEKIALLAQQSGASSWQSTIGKQNRFSLIDNLMSSQYTVLHDIYYNYHIKGFDLLSSQKDQATKAIADNVIKLEKMLNISIGNHMIRLFLDAKADEIVNVFNYDRLTVDTTRMKEVLNRISPTNSQKWDKIK